MAHAKRVVNSGKPAGFRPMRITPGNFWDLKCGALGISLDRWAQRFGLTADEMYQKLNAEVDDLTIDGRQAYGQGKLPDDIWVAFGELDAAFDVKHAEKK